MYKQLVIITIYIFTHFSHILAQTPFEGKIVYDLLYPTTMEEDPVTKKKAPKEKMTVTIYLKDQLMRMETKTATGTSVNICDAKSGTCTALSEMDGKKTAVVMSPEEIEEEEDNHTPDGEKPKAIKLDETKEIAGYVCKKEKIILSKKSSETLMVYYTDKIKSNALNKNFYWVQRRCKRIQGLVLQYEVQNAKGEVIYQLVAKEVSAEPVDFIKFTIPQGYQVADYEKEKKSAGKR
jgi:hypothetical protein